MIYDERIPEDVSKKMDKLKIYAKSLGFKDAEFYFCDDGDVPDYMSCSPDECCPDFSEDYKLQVTMGLGVVCELQATLPKEELNNNTIHSILIKMATSNLNR